MPHIEVIPITGGSAPAPGWAYVPDTGYDPSKAPINPTTRKRTKRLDASSGARGDLNARQQTALLKRLAELDRDNQKDVALPAKAKEGSASARERAGRKMTPAVRKILQSGRTFAHWLADEEALSAQRPGQVSSAAQTAAASPAPAPSSSTPAQSRVAKAKGKTAVSRARHASAAVPSSPATPSATTAAPTAAPSPAPAPAIELPDAPVDDDDPLLRPVVPSVPSAQEIQTLLSHPPLPYAAAKAAPPNPNGPPRRQFCEMCGYWGRVKCLRCAARVCGLECKRAHDETSCMRI